MTQRTLQGVRDDASAVDQALGEEAGDELQDELEGVLTELGGARGEDVVVIVAKYDPKSVKRHNFEYCGRYPLAGFDPFNLPAEWGPGTFRMRFCRGGKIFKAVERSFAAPLRPQSLGAPVSPASDELKASRDFERNLILALIGRATPLAAPVAAPATSAADLLAIFREGRESAKSTPLPLDQLREAISLGRELAGGGSSGDDDDDGPRRGKNPSLLDRLAPQLLGLFDRVMSSPAPALPRALDPPADPAAPPATEPLAGDPPAPAAGGEDPLRGFLKAQASKMIAEAKAGRDARTWGSYMAERCPEQFKEHLYRLASATEPERQAFLAEVAPELLAYRGWVDEACEGVLDVFEPEDDGPDDGEGEGGADAAP